MDTFDAIKSRRSIGKVIDQPIPRNLIEKILEAGIYAPNHYRTEPWRFFVLTGEGRKKLGSVLEEIVRDENMDSDLTVDELTRKIEKAKNNPLRAPVIIAVGVEPSHQKTVLRKEEYAAVHSAVQNMLLASHALGLGAIWRTGQIMYHTKINDFFGVSTNGEIVAFIYIGYPDMKPKAGNKTGFETFTKWMD